MKPFDAKALLGAKKKSADDIAKWARKGVGQQLRAKYGKKPAEESSEGAEHELGESSEYEKGEKEESGGCEGDALCPHCAEMRLIRSISPDAIKKLLFNK